MNTMPTHESNRIEYKATLNDRLERTVVAFLNSREGGLIYIGINDDSHIIGVENPNSLQLKIIDRVKNNIAPNTLGLFDVVLEHHNDKVIIKIIVSSGPEKPYHIKQYGMSTIGCYLRVGNTTQPMPCIMIEEVYREHRRQPRLCEFPAPNRKLSFAQLRIYYEEKGKHLNENFAQTLDLLTKDGQHNYIAFLLADENNVSIKVAKYAGTDKVDLIEYEEYGYCSLIKAAHRVIDKLTIENRTFAQITPTIRKEQKMVEPIALREAVINAIVHNDYTREVPPVFEIYSDKITITSYGGLVAGYTKQDLLNCISVPRNRELMRIFHDLDMVEQLGSGMSRIFKAYDESIFNFTPNFMTVIFPLKQEIVMPDGTIRKITDKKSIDSCALNDDPCALNDDPCALNDDPCALNDDSCALNKEQCALNEEPVAEIILNEIKNNQAITAGELARVAGVSRRTITTILKQLKANGKIKYVGSKKSGYRELA